MDERDFDVSALEYDFCDPEAAKVITNAAFINECLSVAPASDGEVGELIDSLNDSLRERRLIDNNVYITGQGWITTRGDIDEYGNAVLHDGSHMKFHDQEVVLNEFVAHEDRTISESGVSSHYQVYLYGRTLLEVESKGRIEQSYEECVVKIDDETLLRSKGLTPERAERWLSINYPTEMDELLLRCGNTDTTADALLSLGDYTVDMCGRNEVVITEVGSNIEAYLEGVLELEQYVPYLVDIEGRIGLLSTDNSQYRDAEIVKATKPRIAYLYDIAVVYDDVHELLDIWVRGAIVSSDGNDKVPCRMPLSSLQSAVSLIDLIK